jgi:23S rRNA pseudouridine1911/1915/1917 synthase
VAVRLVYRTPGAIVVVKPAGLASELARDPAADSLVSRLTADRHPAPRLVHRLDAAACGLMLVALTKAAAAHYSREIETGRWQKWYVARVAQPIAAARDLVGPHKAYLRTEGRVATVVRSGGKPSFLDVLLAAPAPDAPDTSHVLIRLHTGRFHQIRVMLAQAGAPLAGDRTYGGPGQWPLYLEHVVLGSHADTTGAWTVWQGPPHEDRERWAPELADAVEACVATARTTPPPPDRAP